MKKLILLPTLLILVIFCNCKPKITATNTALPLTPPGTVHQTLDGIDSARAVAMIDTFQKYVKTIKPVMYNFLIKKDTLYKIIKVLTDEYDYEIKNHLKDTTDGIRIYFGSDPKIFSSVSILLVSTFHSDKIDHHYDYYTHSDTSGLIKLKLNGEPGVLATLSTGAALYSTCDTCKDDTNCDYNHNPHYLKRHVAEKMVQNYGKYTPVKQTYAEFFDLKMLQAFLKDPKCDGIRIYFAQHLPTDSVYPSRICFVITTTQKYSGSQTIYTDYFDCKTLQAYFMDYKKRYPNTWYEKPLYPGQDNGELCPDNCN